MLKLYLYFNYFELQWNLVLLLPPVKEISQYIDMEAILDEMVCVYENPIYVELNYNSTMTKPVI